MSLFLRIRLIWTLIKIVIKEHTFYRKDLKSFEDQGANLFYLLGGTCLDGGEVVEGERAMGRHLHKPAIVSYWRARRARALVEMPLSLLRACFF